MTTALRVNNLYATIQGEGALAGTPMIVVRMQGCPVGCPFCDTKHTWANLAPLDNANYIPLANEHGDLGWRGEHERWTMAQAGELAELVHTENRLLGGRIKWVMLTGGEPAAQNLAPFISELHRLGYAINLETSGTMIVGIDAPFDFITCSPKIDMPGGMSLKSGAIAKADEIKFVIGKQADVEKMDAFYAEFGLVLKPNVRKSLQPMSANPKATAMCVALALHRGWAVSIQTHKIMGID